MAIDERLRRGLKALPVEDLDLEGAIRLSVAAGRRRVRRRRALSAAALVSVVIVIFGGVLVRLNQPRRASVTAGIGGDGWTPMAGAPIRGRSGHTLVWTGREVIAWGGVDQDRTSFADGAAYDPVRNRWRPISTPNITGRGYHAATWTGTEMVVWGGVDANGNGLTDGAAYDPVTNQWRRIADSPLAPRLRPVVAWTGREVLVVGGSRIQQDPATPIAAGAGEVSPDQMVDGAAYDPATDRWRGIPRGPVGESAPWTPAVWTGQNLIVMGVGPAVLGPGAQDPGTPRTGLPIASYDPASDEWDQLPSVPLAQNGIPWLAWTGTSLVAALPASESGVAGRAVAYDPATRAWTPLPAPPSAQVQTQDAVWTGHEMLLAGRNGLALDPAAARWRKLPQLDAPAHLEEMKVVWAGDALVAWGAFNPGQPDWDGGGVYRPGPG